MKTLTLEIQNESIAEKVIWMLSHFKNDGVVVKEQVNDTSESIKQAVHEINLVKHGKLEAKPISELFDAM